MINHRRLANFGFATLTPCLQSLDTERSNQPAMNDKYLLHLFSSIPSIRASTDLQNSRNLAPAAGDRIHPDDSQMRSAILSTACLLSNRRLASGNTMLDVFTLMLPISLLAGTMCRRVRATMLSSGSVWLLRLVSFCASSQCHSPYFRGVAMHIIGMLHFA